MQIIMPPSESSEFSQPQMKPNVQPKLRRSNRIKQMKRKRRLTEEQPTDRGKSKRKGALSNMRESECMSNRLEELELEYQEKELEMGRLLDAASEELSRLQENGNVPKYPLYVCTEFNGELFKLYEVPDDVESHIPQNSRTRYKRWLP